MPPTKQKKHLGILFGHQYLKGYTKNTIITCVHMVTVASNTINGIFHPMHKPNLPHQFYHFLVLLAIIATIFHILPKQSVDYPHFFAINVSHIGLHLLHHQQLAMLCWLRVPVTKTRADNSNPYAINCMLVSGGYATICTAVPV